MKVIEYQTSDIYFAGYINALGNQLDGTKKESENGKEKTIFVFKLEEDKVQELKTDFFGGSGKVTAKDYMYSLKSLKSLCFIR